MIFGILILGLMLGSFLNVVIHRVPIRMSIVSPRSHCPECGRPVRIKDNVPILSYLWLKGRCRDCGIRIPCRYPLVEALTAGVLILFYIKFGFSWRLLVYGLLSLFLIAIAFIDAEKKIVPNRLTIPGFILGIAMTPLFQIEKPLSVLLGAVAGGAVCLALGWFGKAVFRKDSLGMGDVKLLVMIGAYVGFPDVFFCLFFAVVVAAVYIACAMILRKMKLGAIIPFGPFIAVGTLVYLLSGQAILAWYVRMVSM
jgi:leader peptidase (prepilin peptidase)/N-methyltransferase